MTAETPENRVAPTVEHLLREVAPQVLTAVARRYEDFAAAEDAVELRDGLKPGAIGGLSDAQFTIAKQILDHLDADARQKISEGDAGGVLENPAEVVPAEVGLIGGLFQRHAVSGVGKQKGFRARDGSGVSRNLRED